MWASKHILIRPNWFLIGHWILTNPYSRSSRPGSGVSPLPVVVHYVVLFLCFRLIASKLVYPWPDSINRIQPTTNDFVVGSIDGSSSRHSSRLMEMRLVLMDWNRNMCSLRCGGSKNNCMIFC